MTAAVFTVSWDVSAIPVVAHSADTDCPTASVPKARAEHSALVPVIPPLSSSRDTTTSAIGTLPVFVAVSRHCASTPSGRVAWSTHCASSARSQPAPVSQTCLLNARAGAGMSTSACETFDSTPPLP
ncbi:hypothetical protein ATY41_07035 [Leifsonia xyli subsp. xyli]|uniref:Uncharacterized protein n=1 Tax=Leifsonia xyli subsp. xyli TaxID=59736 RepID=A0A1E2SMM1_LEIXY|nr:hypothetical protein ATY41_07035 [Leifsonia xyli subsp. xyli]